MMATDFQNALLAQGFTVTTGQSMRQPFLSVDGKQWSADDQPLQVYEYSDAVAAMRDTTNISNSGTKIGTTDVTWGDTPHFYQAGSLIILYVGHDTHLLSVLNDILGPQFAGGPETGTGSVIHGTGAVLP
jgi:hypothetical protein